MQISEKKARGRPKTLGAKVLVALSVPELTALDSWRSEHPEKPNRPEAIRLMIGQVTAPKLAGPIDWPDAEMAARMDALAQARNAQLTAAAHSSGSLKPDVPGKLAAPVTMSGEPIQRPLGNPKTRKPPPK